jgi:hypothetical protein
VPLGALVLAAVCATAQLKATTTYVGTVSNASAWTVTYDGPSGNVTGTAMPTPGGDNISLSSDGEGDGSFVGAGGSLTNSDLASAFNGAWIANLSFFIPADAVDVVLTFADLAVDDRVVLELNGAPIGNAGLQGTTNASGVMSFVLDSPGTTTPQDFDADTSGSITTGFILGGSNDLELVVNNTNAAPDFTHGTNLAQPTQGFQTSGDATLVGVNATISFGTVPEPGTLILFGTALAGVGVLRLRRR